MSTHKLCDWAWTSISFPDRCGMRETQSLRRFVRRRGILPSHFVCFPKASNEWTRIRFRSLTPLRCECHWIILFAPVVYTLRYEKKSFYIQENDERTQGGPLRKTYNCVRKPKACTQIALSRPKCKTPRGLLPTKGHADSPNAVAEEVALVFDKWDNSAGAARIWKSQEASGQRQRGHLNRLRWKKEFKQTSSYPRRNGWRHQLRSLKRFPYPCTNIYSHHIWAVGLTELKTKLSSSG